MQDLCKTGTMKVAEWIDLASSLEIDGIFKVLPPEIEYSLSMLVKVKRTPGSLFLIPI